MKNPRSRVVCSETNSDFIACSTDVNDIAARRVSVIGSAIEGRDDIEGMLSDSIRDFHDELMGDLLRANGRGELAGNWQ